MRLVKTIMGSHHVVKIYRNVAWNEYRVRIVGVPSADYYCPDKEDALLTAEQMANRA